MQADHHNPLGRAAAYGDGLFETIAVFAGEPLWLDEHLHRLKNGASRLTLDVDLALLKREVTTLLTRSGDHGVLKIILSRQSVGRGYTPETRASDRTLQWFPGMPADRSNWSNGVKLMLCQQRLAEQPILAGIKHLNRLEQVLAAAELRERRVLEGLMLDQRGCVIEGTRSNVFVVRHGELFTPRLVGSGVAGIMRDKIIAASAELGLNCRQCDLSLDDIYLAEEMLVCNSIFGIWPVVALDCVIKAIGPVSRLLQTYFDADFYA